MRNSKIAEMEIDGGDMVISGSKRFKWKSRNDTLMRHSAGARLSLRASRLRFPSGTTAWEMNSYARFRARPLRRHLPQPRRPPLARAQGRDHLHLRPARDLERCRRRPTGRFTPPPAIAAASIQHRSRRQELAAVDRRPARDLRPRDRPAKASLYAGTSPDGKVYRIENGKATEYFAPKAKYIWSLAAAPDGALYVGTGDQGKIFAWTPPAKANSTTRPASRTSPASRSIRRAACSPAREPNGILYRITAKDKAFVLYDANLPEIRAIVPDARWHASMPRRSADPSPSARRAPRRPRKAGRQRRLTDRHHHDHHRGSAGRPAVKSSRPSRKPQGPASPPPRRRSARNSLPWWMSSGVEKSARLPHQPGQHRRDAVDFQGRKRLRPAGARAADPVLHRRERPHLRTLAGPPRHPGGADQ